MRPSYIYACYSRYCDWVKVGFSTRPQQRFLELNKSYPAFAPFTPIGTVLGCIEAEQQFHRAMRPFRWRGGVGSIELYPATKSVLDIVRIVLGMTYYWPFDDLEMACFEDWAAHAARHPLNRVIIRECFDREHRRAA